MFHTFDVFQEEVLVFQGDVTAVAAMVLGDLLKMLAKHLRTDAFGYITLYAFKFGFVHGPVGGWFAVSGAAGALLIELGPTSPAWRVPT